MARRLLADGWRVRAMARRPDAPESKALARVGAEVVKGDFNDPASLEMATQGVYGVFAVHTFWQDGYEGEVRHGKALAEAAKAAKVRHYVYSSVGGADRLTGVPHFETKWRIELHVRAMGFPATIVRPVFFMENFMTGDSRSSLLDGQLRMALLPETRLQMIAVEDIGGVVGVVFQKPDAFAGKAIEIAGDEMTMPQAAGVFSRVLRRPVRFVETPIEDLRRTSQDFAAMFEWFNREGYRADIAALRTVCPGLMTLEAWLTKGVGGTRGMPAGSVDGAPSTTKIEPRTLFALASHPISARE